MRPNDRASLDRQRLGFIQSCLGLGESLARPLYFLVAKMGEFLGLKMGGVRVFESAAQLVDLMLSRMRQLFDRNVRSVYACEVVLQFGQARGVARDRLPGVGQRSRVT